MIELYHFPAACSRVTMTALEEIGLAYTPICVNLRASAQKDDAYLAINPKGTVPAIVFDGRVMTENAAILWYLHAQHPKAGLLPEGDDAQSRFAPLSDLVWCSGTLHPNVRQIRMPAKLTRGDTDGVRADGLAKFALQCGRIAARIADGWWYSDRWSIVDTYLYWAYSTARKGGFPLDDYPVLIDHARRVRERPSFQRVLEVEAAAVAADAIQDVEL